MGGGVKQPAVPEQPAEAQPAGPESTGTQGFPPCCITALRHCAPLLLLLLENNQCKEAVCGMLIQGQRMWSALATPATGALEMPL